MSSGATAAPIQTVRVPKGQYVNDMKSFVLMICLAIPSIVMSYFILAVCPTAVEVPNMLKPLCSAPPMNAFHFILFVNFIVLFWIVSLFTGSTWHTTPFWYFIPVLGFHFYQFTPRAIYRPRVPIVGVLVWVWALSLFYNHFRREEWHFGFREDLRLVELRKLFPKFFWITSLIAAFVLPTIIFGSVTMCFYYVHVSRRELSQRDLTGALMMLLGVVIEIWSDYELRAWTVKQEIRARAGKSRQSLLNDGLWYFSRHPNYFGELLFWWGLAVIGFGVSDSAWCFAGAMISSTWLLGIHIDFIADRHLQRGRRRNAYQAYMRTTSPIIPWMKFEDEKKKGSGKKPRKTK